MPARYCRHSRNTIKPGNLHPPARGLANRLRAKLDSLLQNPHGVHRDVDNVNVNEGDRPTGNSKDRALRKATREAIATELQANPDRPDATVSRVVTGSPNSDKLVRELRTELELKSVIPIIPSRRGQPPKDGTRAKPLPIATATAAIPAEPDEQPLTQEQCEAFDPEPLEPRRGLSYPWPMLAV